MVANEDQGVIRVEAVQNRRVEQDAAYAQYRQSGKPQQHDGAKHHADFLATKALNGKQNHQNGQRQRQNSGMPIGIDDGQTFGSRQQRNRGRNHRIAIKQGSAEQAHEQHKRNRFAMQILFGQLHQHHDAAFAVVVGAQHNEHVFDGHHQNNRPKNQRHKAHHIHGIEFDVGGSETFF